MGYSRVKQGQWVSVRLEVQQLLRLDNSRRRDCLKDQGQRSQAQKMR